jgi:hypothetical protein
MRTPQRSRLVALSAAVLLIVVAAAPAGAFTRAAQAAPEVVTDERAPGIQVPSHRGLSGGRRTMDPRAVARPLPERAPGDGKGGRSPSPIAEPDGGAGQATREPGRTAAPAEISVTATTPTTTTLLAPTEPVVYPEQVHLEAVVDPIPSPIDGATPAIAFTLDGNFWRPAPIDDQGHAFVTESLPLGSYEFAAEFGPWGDLEASASAPATVDVVQAPSLATPLAGTAVQSSHGFAGFSPASDPFYADPAPSPGLAVGPDDIVQVTSAGFRFFDRSGQPMFDVPLADFFLETDSAIDHDRQPQILFDDLHDRWIAVEVTWGQEGHLIVAISTSPDPTDFWWVYDFSLGSNGFPDSPSIGVSSNKVGIGLNEWTANQSDFAGGRMLVISSASIVDGDGTITYDATEADPNQASWRPAVAQSTGNTLHAVGTVPGFGQGDLLHMSVTGSVATGATFTVENLTSGPLEIPDAGDTVYAYAPTSELGDAVGYPMPQGPTQAVWQSGKLWFVSTRSCLPPAGLSASACVRVTELSTGATTGLIQDFVVNSEGRSTYGGGIAVTGANDLVLAFTRSSQFLGPVTPSPISHLVAVQKATDAPNSLHVPALIDTSDGYYATDAWSPTTPVVRDPASAAGVWQGGVVTTATGWRTWISRLSVASGTLNGTLVLNGGRSHVNALRISVGGSLTASNRGTRMRLSNSSAAAGGNLSMAREFATSDGVAWSLADPDTGGSSATGTHHVYVQWGDGAGTWSAVENASIVVDAPLGGSFVPLNPARLLDTRTGNGLSGKFVALQPRSFQVTGRGGVPANAVAVTGNLTVTGPSRSGYVFLGPTATATPTSSTLNFSLSETAANGVIVKLSGTGKLAAVYVAPASASTHLIFDVTGYFVVADPNAPSGTTWRPIEPLRVVDSRFGVGLPSKLMNGQRQVFAVTGFGIPATATAVTGNITLTGQTSAGYAFVGPQTSSNPTSSTINVVVKDTRANNTTVQLGAGGTLAVVWRGAPGSSTHVIFDVTGYFVAGPSGATFVPVTPARVLDSRFGVGLDGFFEDGVPRTLTVAGVGGIPAADTVGLTGNLTAVDSMPGYVFLGPTPIAEPTSSTINFGFGVRANGVAVAIADGASVSATFRGTSSHDVRDTNLILDVTGYFR